MACGRRARRGNGRYRRTASAAALLAATCVTGCASPSGAAPGTDARGPGGIGVLATQLGDGATTQPASATGPSAAESTRVASASTSSTASPTGSSGQDSPTSVAGLPPATATRTAQAGQLLGFATPSHNIACSMDSTQVRCDIQSRTWNPPPKPADCQLDYGQGVVLATDVPHFVCAGDTVLDPAAPVLPYNEAARAGDLVCVSTQAYLICRNVVTGHGFSLSRTTFPPLY